VGVQHLLRTTGSLVQALIALGAKPDAIHLLGKPYSTHGETEETLRRIGVDVRTAPYPSSRGDFEATFRRSTDELWTSAITAAAEVAHDEAFIVLDDGGYLHERLMTKTEPSVLRIAGVEQTTSGLAAARRAPYEVIEVASSAAKRVVESPLIARQVIDRCGDLLQQSRKPLCGIVGYGAIGKAVAEALQLRGYDIRILDDDVQLRGREACRSLGELLEKCDIVFGCSGAPLRISPEFLAARRSPVFLVSCSSDDREFRNVLRSAPRETKNAPLATVAVGNARVVHGGYPITFDGTADAVPPDDIQLTRALLLAGVVQARVAVAAGSASRGGTMLAPAWQRLVVRAWARERAIERREFRSLPEIARLSGGRAPADVSIASLKVL
jgi:hypothetical protein